MTDQELKEKCQSAIDQDWSLPVTGIIFAKACLVLLAERDAMRGELGAWVEYFGAIELKQVGPPREQIRTFEKILLDRSRDALSKLDAVGGERT